MSADNGVYILHTKDGYRVAHCQAIENINWNGSSSNDKNHFNKEYLNRLFGNCTVHQTADEALKEANKIYEKILSDDFCPVCEYGICFINAEVIEFPTPQKKFIRPEGHDACELSTTIADEPSFGTGELDNNGFWEFPCYECARAWEKQYPGEGECWPSKTSKIAPFYYEAVLMSSKEGIYLKKELIFTMKFNPAEKDPVLVQYKMKLSNQVIYNTTSLFNAIDKFNSYNIRGTGTVT